METTASREGWDRAGFDEDVRYVLANLDRKLAEWGSRWGFVRHVLALYRYLVDPQVHWSKKLLVVASLVYVIVPLDTIPDVAPIVGFVDDALVVAAAVKTLGKALEPYYR